MQIGSGEGGETWQLGASRRNLINLVEARESIVGGGEFLYWKAVFICLALSNGNGKGRVGQVMNGQGGRK